MPRRKLVLANGQTYHVFNKCIQGVEIFCKKRDTEIFLLATKYYLQFKPSAKFSVFRQQKSKYSINLKNKLVNLLAYCLMPNHFHLILTQIKTKGIEKFISRLTNSFSHYFNTKYNRKGSLFESSFKAVRIATEQQLIHLTRYIHLNPVTSYLVNNPINYPYSSYKTYIGKHKEDFVDDSVIRSIFSSRKEYKTFVLDRKDYQRQLAQLKSHILE